MSEIFKTILILSALGSVLIIPLLILKPYISRRISGSLQYCLWIAVMLSMLLPVYKLIPLSKTTITATPYVIPIVPTDNTLTHHNQAPQQSITQSNESTPAPVTEQTLKTNFHLNTPDFLAYIWIFGMSIYLITISFSYIIYLTKNRKNSVTLNQNPILDKAKETLNIKRQIRVRMSPEVRSPMLVGVLLPTVYIPCREIPDENLQMVFLHELTHLKRKDLVIKWLSIFTNAAHWFNPFAYLLCANLSEACEISCDMAVTKKMSNEEQKTYIKTILELVE